MNCHLVGRRALRGGDSMRPSTLTLRCWRQPATQPLRRRRTRSRKRLLSSTLTRLSRIVRQSLQVFAAWRNPHQSRLVYRAFFPDEPSVAGCSRRLYIDAPPNHRNALCKLREFRRRIALKDAVVATDAFEKNGSREDRNAAPRHVERPQHELYAQSEWRVCDDPVHGVQLVRVG